MVNLTPAPEAPIETLEQEETQPHIGRIIALVLATVLAVLGLVVAVYSLFTHHYLLLITALGLFCVPAFLTWVIISKNQTSSPMQWGIVGIIAGLLTVLGVFGSGLSAGDEDIPSEQEETRTAPETTITESTSPSSENKKPKTSSASATESEKPKDNKESTEPQARENDTQRGNTSNLTGNTANQADQHSNSGNSAPAPARNGVPSHQGAVKTATNNWDYTRNTPLPTRGTHPNTNSGNTDANFVFDNPTPTPKPAPELIPDPAPEETPAPEPIDEAVDNTDDSTSEIVS